MSDAKASPAKNMTTEASTAARTYKAASLAVFDRSGERPALSLVTSPMT